MNIKQCWNVKCNGNNSGVPILKSETVKVNGVWLYCEKLYIYIKPYQLKIVLCMCVRLTFLNGRSSN